MDLKLRLPELLLMRVDKMTMATAVEARVPFLDHEFVRFVMGIPQATKMRGGELKHLLKRAVRGVIPDADHRPPEAGIRCSRGGVVPAGTGTRCPGVAPAVRHRTAVLRRGVRGPPTSKQQRHVELVPVQLRLVAPTVDRREGSAPGGASCHSDRRRWALVSLGVTAGADSLRGLSRRAARAARAGCG